MAALRPPAWGLLALLCLLLAATASALTPCPPGTARVGTSPTCTGCAKGKYSAGGSAPCAACPPCYTTPGANSTSSASCVCAPGCGRNATGLCSACAAGSYSAGGTATNKLPNCTACTAGKTTNGTGAVSLAACTVCRPGYGGANCVACARGLWSAGGNTSAGGNLTPNCTACAAGATTASTASTRAADCSWCTPGFGVSAPSTVCTACRRGTWSAGGVAGTPKPNCTACDVGTTTDAPGRTSVSACKICLPGYGFATVNNVSVCQVCAKGRWSAGGNATASKPLCTACSSPFTTTAAGSTANASCTVRICAAGRGGDATCPLCLKGTWAAAGTAAAPVPSCTPCGPNATTPSTGATASSACSVCVPGYGKVGAASRCDICPVNTFSPGGNATNQMPPCTACPAGSTAATPGATACQTAPPPSGGCTFSNPVCGAQQDCDLTALAANKTGGSCLASMACPACPRGYECVATAAALAFPGARPWCIKKTTCDPACAADEFCEPGDDWEPYHAPYCRKNSDVCGTCNAGQVCDTSMRQCVTRCATDKDCPTPSSLPGFPPRMPQYCNNDSKTCQEDPCSYFNGTAYVRGCATAGAVCMQPPGYLRSCKVVCTPNGTECNALSPMFCDNTTLSCIQDSCTYWNNGFQRGCQAGYQCMQLLPGQPRSCQPTTCYTPCTAPLTCARDQWGTMGCLDTRCSPGCGKNTMCDPVANTCTPMCGDNPPCAAGTICVGFGYPNASCQACSTPCGPKERCMAKADYSHGWPPTFKAVCGSNCANGCPEGFSCDEEEGTCRVMTCSPACPAGSTCVEVAGKPACRATCSPACAAGYACDLTASPPKCILPSPANFSVVLRIGERFQTGKPSDTRVSEELDAPVGFLGEYVSGDPYTICNPCVQNNTCNFNNVDGYDARTWAKTFTTTGVFNDSRGDEGALAQKWREVIVDAGGALAAGKWSGKADIQVYARSLNIYDQNNKLQPARPLELQVGLRHKATGATYMESYTTIATLGAEEPNSESELCYHGSDALSAIVTVTTTPSKDRLAYSLNIVKPYDPSAPAPAAAAAAASEALPGDDGTFGVKITPQIAAYMAEVDKQRKADRNSTEAEGPEGGPGSEPVLRGGPLLNQGAPGARRR